MNPINVVSSQETRKNWIVGNALGTVIDIGCNTGFIFRDWKADVTFCDQYHPIENLVLGALRSNGIKPKEAERLLKEMSAKVRYPIELIKQFGNIDEKEVTTVMNNVVPKFRKCKASYLPFVDSAFDTGVLGDMLEHVSDPVVCIQEAKRVARHQVLITVPDEEKWAATSFPLWLGNDKDWSDHVRQYTSYMLAGDIKKADIDNFEITNVHDGRMAFFLARCIL